MGFLIFNLVNTNSPHRSVLVRYLSFSSELRINGANTYQATSTCRELRNQIQHLPIFDRYITV